MDELVLFFILSFNYAKKSRYQNCETLINKVFYFLNKQYL